MNAFRELVATLVDAVRCADLVGRLAEWGWVITHPERLDGRDISWEIVCEDSYQDTLFNREYIQVLKVLLVERDRLLDAIPECPVHGNQCVPHALEWVEAQKEPLV